MRVRSEEEEGTWKRSEFEKNTTAAALALQRTHLQENSPVFSSQFAPNPDLK